jgi:shikimate kinase
MIGEATAMGAISIVNAIACGKGGSLAVRLPTLAKVELIERRGGWRVFANGRPVTSSLGVKAVRNAIRMLGTEPARFSGTIQTTTSVPIGVGLKTSSSSSVAIILAVLSAFGKKKYNADDVLRCSASSSLAAGVSLTGALDDAASCLMGGVNLADNSAKRVLSSSRAGHPMDVLIRVPREGSRRALVQSGYVKRFSRVAESIFSMGMEGRIWKAMTLNGLLYCSIYGYSPYDATQALAANALGAGLSGTGPAVGAVFEDEDGLERLAGEWGKGGATLIRTQTTDRGAAFGS